MQDFEFNRFAKLIMRFNKSPYFCFIPDTSHLFKWGGEWLDKKIMLHALAYTPPKIVKEGEIASVEFNGLRFNKIPVRQDMLISTETINVLLDDSRRYDANQSNLYVYGQDCSNSRVTIPPMEFVSAKKRDLYGKAIQSAQISKKTLSHVIHEKEKLIAEKEAIHHQFLEKDTAFTAAKSETVILSKQTHDLTKKILENEKRESLISHKLKMSEIESKSLREENEALQKYLSEKDTVFAKMQKNQSKIMADLDLLSKLTFSEEKFKVEMDKIIDLVKKQKPASTGLEDIGLTEVVTPPVEKVEKDSEESEEDVKK